MTSVAFACADCMEEAGGRQRRHGIAWHVDICPCCNSRSALAATRDFGYPPLEPIVLPLENPPHEPG